jgi:hypothetical protein
MLRTFKNVDWTIVLVMAFVFCIAIGALQFVNGIGDAERGLILFEKSCRLNVGALLTQPPASADRIGANA